jgi:hypothetical protein
MQPELFAKPDELTNTRFKNGISFFNVSHKSNTFCSHALYEIIICSKDQFIQEPYKIITFLILGGIFGFQIYFRINLV